MTQERFRCVCFTLNNWTEEEKESLLNFQDKTYIIIGLEIGKENTPHLQGYLEFSKRKSMQQLKKINNRIHWEPRYGSQKQAVNYCKKDGNFIEAGEMKIQGERSDLKKYRDLVKKNNKLRELLDNENDIPNLQTIRICEKYLTYCEKARSWKPEVIWIHGASGLGKTRLAYELCKNEDIYVKDDTQWWDGYDNHKTIILDDFRGKNMAFTYLLKLLDRYEMRLQIKGGYRQCQANKIIITSINRSESSYRFTEEGEPYKQLQRRIDYEIHLKEEGDWLKILENTTILKSGQRSG